MDYKEILKGIVNIINTTEKSDIGFTNICTYIGENCPELRESDDERIRKEILEYFQQFENEELRGINISDWIAWLKKQGEQKPEIKYIYPKFRVGDVIEPAKPNGSYIPVRVRHISDGSYSCESDDRKAFSSIPICNENEYVLTKQKPAEW